MNDDEQQRGVRQRMARNTRRSFLAGGAAAGGVFAAYEWLAHAQQIGQLESPLRRAEQFNAALSRVLFSGSQLAPTYPASRSQELRLNGNLGQDLDMMLDSWRLQVVGLAHPQQYRQFIEDVDLWEYKTNSAGGGGQGASNAEPAPDPKVAQTDPLTGPHIEVQQTINITVPAGDTSRTPGIVLSLADLRALPFTEQVTQFKCIEGWSQITSFGGVRFADFLKAYPPERKADGSLPRYVTMETADGTFSSSFDMESLLHPQTLLCYQMNAQPLSPGHGAPLRLATPFKYGYKQIKQVAKLTYTDQRAPDFWEGLGYDWYAGL